MPVIDMLQNVALDELSLWDRNPRVINPDRFADLVRSLSEDPRMMTARPLIAMKDGRVIAGNMRLRAARELGWEEVPVVYVDIDEDRATTWALRDNVSYGDWEDQRLGELLEDLNSRNVDLSLTGFPEDDIAALFDEMHPENRPQVRGMDLALADVSIGDPVHVVETGDVWKVGRHHLVCASVYSGWPQFLPYLAGDVLLVPYPTPTVPLTAKADLANLVMVQPDRWLAGHLLDKFAAVRGDDEVEKL